MMKVDWYLTIKRSALVAFVFLTVWAVMQASSLYTIWNGMMPYFMWGESLKQFLFVVFWPITYTPLWFKFLYFALGLWLIYPYIWRGVPTV